MANNVAHWKASKFGALSFWCHSDWGIQINISQKNGTQIEATVPEKFKITRFPPKLKIRIFWPFLPIFYLVIRTKKVKILLALMKKVTARKNVRI